MSNELQGRKVAILAADGVEKVELDQPREALEEAGAEVELLSPKAGEIQARNHDLVPAGFLPSTARCRTHRWTNSTVWCCPAGR